MTCPCTSGSGLGSAILSDLDRVIYHLDPAPGARPRRGPLTLLKVVAFFPGFAAVLLYRIAHLLHTRLPGILAVTAWIPTRISGILIGVNLSPAMHAGPGLMVNHTGNVFFGPVSVGSNCNVSHGVTVGQSSTTDAGVIDVPTIGDRVWIGPNAVVIGSIHLSDDCVVSANSLVFKDVPAGGFAIGVPARVVSRLGSFRQVRYYGMESDPERSEALAALQGLERPAARAAAPAGPITGVVPGSRPPHPGGATPLAEPPQGAELQAP